MSDFLLYASVVALFLVCILVVLVILMQTRKRATTEA